MASATEALKEKAGLTKKKPGFFDMLEAMKPQIAMALPRHLTPDRMIRIALTCCRLNPRLLECTPESLIAAIMISSQLGLEPGVMGQSFLVPFKRKDVYICQLIPGWMGILDLVNRSGKATAWTGAVYGGDAFDWALGDSPYLRHKPSGDETKLTHVYAIARAVNSQWPLIEVWPIEKVWKHRDRYNKVGEDHYSYKYPEMYARKVALLQTLKYVPKSIELQAAISLDNEAEAGGQTLAIKDVPAIIEGTGVFDTPEQLPAKPDVKGKTAPVDEICNECQTLNGHTLDCKYHPRNQLRVAPNPAEKVVDSQSTNSAETPAEKANPFPKTEATQAEPVKAPPDAVKKLVRVKKVEKKKSVDDKPYYKVTAFEEDGTALTMICWHHKTIGPAIYDRYTENGLAVFLVFEKHDKAKPYFEIVDIVSLAGKDYKDGKPIPDAAPVADDETW